MRFEDRRHAGRVLANLLLSLRGRDDVVVLALPRGGVPVAAEIANVLDAPLDVFLVRKLGVPSHPELAMGAIAQGGVRVLNDDVIRRAEIEPEEILAVEEREAFELERRDELYRGGRTPLDITEKIAVLVDDGLATGATMRAAVEAAKRLAPKRVIVAVPVGAIDTCASLRELADDVVCAVTVDDLVAVGFWYFDFTQTSDDEVREALADHSRSAANVEEAAPVDVS